MKALCDEPARICARGSCIVAGAEDAGKWQATRLDELGVLARGRSRHRPRDAAHLYGGPHPFVQTGDIKHAGLYVSEYSQSYSEAGLEQSKMWPKGTLCITIAANIGDTAILGFDACFPDSVIGFLADETKCDTRFIKYRFDTVKQQFQQVSQGAAQDNLSMEKLLALKIEVPPLATQHRIADILSAYDDLIENNRRRITLLEQAARHLYEEWFVRLKFPGHERIRLVNGVPEGWERMPLGDALTLHRGYDLPEDSREAGEIPIYASTGITGFHSIAKVSGPGVVTGRSGTLGKVLYIPGSFWPLNTTLFVSEFRRITPVFAFFLLRTLNLDQYNGGASVPTLDRKAAHRIDIILPSKQLCELFEEQVQPMLTMIEMLNNQNQKLRAARNLLLPRVMSGEVAA